MTNLKSKKEALPTQAWFDGFEKYREKTALFPHPEEPEPKQFQGAVLPGFDQMMTQHKKRVSISHISFPMLPYKGKTR